MALHLRSFPPRVREGDCFRVKMGYLKGANYRPFWIAFVAPRPPFRSPQGSILGALGSILGGQGTPRDIPGGPWDANEDQGPTFNDFWRILGSHWETLGTPFGSFFVIFASLVGVRIASSATEPFISTFY